MSKGDVCITLFDANKNVLLTLDQETQQGCITPDPKKKYYLVIKYAKMDGKYEQKTFFYYEYDSNNLEFTFATLLLDSQK